MAAPLEHRLVQARLVKPELLAAVAAQRQRTGRPLGDCLIAAGALTEESLLGFLERESGAEAMLTRRLARAFVSPWVLDRVPSQLADELSVLPLAFEDATQTLTLALVDPADTEVISKVILAARPRGVRRVAALESAIRAGIRKFYYSESDAFAADGRPKQLHYRCTHCRTWLSGAVVWCTGCYLLLDPSAPEATPETSVIRVLLGDPLQPKGTRPEPGSEDSTASRPFVPLTAVVAMASEARLQPDNLRPFEAFVASRANGSRTIADIARVCGLAEVEAQAVATQLVGRGVLAILPAGSPGPRPAPGSAAPVEGAGTNREQWDLLEEAVRCEQAGDLDAAIRILTKGIERMSNAPRLYNRLAAVLLRRSDHFGALFLLERAVSLDPTNPVLARNVSQLREMVGQK